MTNPQPYIWLCEGEPDVICAISHGLEAVTATTGAGSWKPEYNRHFQGREVVVCYDADSAGQQGGRKVARALAGSASGVRVLEWPEFMTDGQDLTDWFTTHGRTVAELVDLADSIEPFEPDDLEGDPDQASPDPYKYYQEGLTGDRLRFKPKLLADDLNRLLDLAQDPESGQIYRWTGQIWDRIKLADVAALADKLLGDEAQVNQADNAATLAVRSRRLQPGQRMDQDEDLVTLENGIFNLRTGRVSAHDRKHRLTTLLPLEFDPQNPPPCPRWQKFIAESVPDEVGQGELKEFVGYCLTTSVRYHQWLLLLGEGASGKSTFINVVKELVGEQGWSSVPIYGLQDQFQRSQLQGKRINVGDEVEGPAMETDVLKSIVSGGAILASYKHQDGFNLIPTCKLIFAANAWPRVRDSSSGFFRRVIPIRFGRERRPEERDPNLLDDLKAELPGIFGWAWSGLLALRQRGYFRLSAPTVAALDEYRSSNSHVALFLEEMCRTEGEVPKDRLYERYKDWTEDAGLRRPLAKTTFSAELKKLVSGLTESKRRAEPGSSKRIRWWVGVSLETAPAPPLGY